jgi:hypothetical protein
MWIEIYTLDTTFFANDIELVRRSIRTRVREVYEVILKDVPGCGHGF